MTKTTKTHRGLASRALWMSLVLPAIAMCWRVFVSGTHPAEMLHGSGEVSARLLIASMTIALLRMLFPRALWLSWLRRHRRALGLAVRGICCFPRSRPPRARWRSWPRVFIPSFRFCFRKRPCIGVLIAQTTNPPIATGGWPQSTRNRTFSRPGGAQYQSGRQVSLRSVT